jgi:hypothetical protein
VLPVWRTSQGWLQACLSFNSWYSMLMYCLPPLLPLPAPLPVPLAEASPASSAIF